MSILALAGRMTGWAVLALLVFAAALLVKLKLGSARETRWVREWLRRF